MMVQTGAADVVMAGGVESMSNVEYYTTDMRWGKRAGSVVLHDRHEVLGLDSGAIGKLHDAGVVAGAQSDPTVAS